MSEQICNLKKLGGGSSGKVVDKIFIITHSQATPTYDYIYEVLDDGTTSLLYTVSYWGPNDGTAYYENAYFNVVGKSNSAGYGGANYIFKKKGYDTWSQVYKNVGDTIYLSVHTSPAYFHDVIIFYKE